MLSRVHKFRLPSGCHKLARYKRTRRARNNLQKGEMQNMRKSLKTLTSFLIPALALTLFTTSALAFPGGKPGAAAPAPANSVPMTSPKGTVLETMESGGYTYLNIDNAGQKTWAAIPKSPVKVGQQVEIAPGMTMNQFTSKTLGRTFDAIVFSRGLISAK